LNSFTISTGSNLLPVIVSYLLAFNMKNLYELYHGNNTSLMILSTPDFLNFNGSALTTGLLHNYNLTLSTPKVLATSIGSG